MLPQLREKPMKHETKPDERRFGWGYSSAVRLQGVWQAGVDG